MSTGIRPMGEVTMHFHSSVHKCKMTWKPDEAETPTVPSLVEGAYAMEVSFSEAHPFHIDLAHQGIRIVFFPDSFVVEKLE